MKKKCKYWVGKCPTECPPGVGPGCEIVAKARDKVLRVWCHVHDDGEAHASTNPAFTKGFIKGTLTIKAADWEKLVRKKDL